MEKPFPIMGINYEYRKQIERIRDAGDMMVCVGVPWGLMAPHEAQARNNHSQSLARLAERGGLSASEAVAVIQHVSQFKLRITEVEANRALIGYVFAFYNNRRHLDWAVEGWNAQVKDRPLINIHRRSLDDAWRQVIRHFGGDPVALCGPAHDELLAQAKE